MRERNVLVLVVALASLIVIGCGGNDGGDEVPQSSAAYAGSSMPAVLDSTSDTQSMAPYLLQDVAYLAGQFGGGIRVDLLGSTSSNTSDYVEGGDSGSFTYSGSYSYNWSDTLADSSVVQSLTFHDFADSSGVDILYTEGSGGMVPRSLSVTRAAPPAAISGIYYEDLLAGQGSQYRRTRQILTTDGILSEEFIPNSLAIGPENLGPVGNILTETSEYYNNYGSLFTRTGHDYDGYSALERRILQSGFISGDMRGAYDYSLEAVAFEDTISADYSRDYFYSYTSDFPEESRYAYTQGLLGFSQTHAWDLSTASFISSGTYCAEGEVESYVLGCLDFDVSLQWENNAAGDYSYCRGTYNPIGCYGQPVEGLVTLQADGATASFSYTPGGTTFTFDAGDGSAVFQTTLPPIGDF